MLSRSETNQILQVFRDYDRRKKDGLVESVPTSLCLCCKKKKPVPEMNFILSTGIIHNVLDCLCKACETEHRRIFAQAARVICAGCRETVVMLEPEKEKSGFEWKAGGYYHVARCPVCAKDPTLKSSPVVEQIAFYKARGIPY